MVTLSYDPYLLITTKKGVFGVVGIQTDDTLFLEFTTLEDSELNKAHLTTKPRDELSTKSNLIFNRYVITMNSDSTIHLTQKDQGKKLQPVNKQAENLQQDYLE